LDNSSFHCCTLFGDQGAILGGLVNAVRAGIRAARRDVVMLTRRLHARIKPLRVARLRPIHVIALVATAERGIAPAMFLIAKLIFALAAKLKMAIFGEFDRGRGARVAHEPEQTSDAPGQILQVVVPVHGRSPMLPKV
jgi:hypothetical protein